MRLGDYQRKRDFTRTSEPRAGRPRSRGASAGRSYVIQKHAASRLHYDFRLEHEGALLSWAVPKGPSLDPADKRLAVQVEDHPVDYGSFEGVIPKGQYGGGTVLLWDRGSWIPEGDVDAGLKKGKLDFVLRGEKLGGAWRLVRLRERNGAEAKNWLLIKRTDEAARKSGAAITADRPESVASGKQIDEIGSARGKAPRASVASVRAPRSGALTKLAAGLEGARRAALPGFVPVQLAFLVDAPPEGAGWIHEVKYDGYRMLAELDRGKVRWWSRNGLDWSPRCAPLSPAIAKLPARRALIDGEVVVLDEQGVSHFQRVQQAFGKPDAEQLSYFAFDLLHLDGYDLRGCRLSDRKRVLQALLARLGPSAPLRFSEHVESDGVAFLHAACEHALEGVVSKRIDATYRSGRSREWMKAKCGHRQEFVVAGFTEPRRSRTDLGALALAVRAGKGWRYAGRVGTGFDAQTRSRLRKRLEPLRRDAPEFEKPLSTANARGVAWVEPRVVVEIAFAGWTADGLVRHATFQGVREDKHAQSVVRESSSPSTRSTRKTSRTADASETVAGVRITHPARIVDAESGVTKLDVARYYAGVASLLLPHIAGRPLSVLRCPDGFAGPSFFQKHGGGMFPDAVKSIAVRESGGTARHLMVDSVEGLIALVQMNVIELHPWGAPGDRPLEPDRICFDLDPAPDVEWRRVVEGALTLRAALARVHMASFVKTTGGKGLHVVVPLGRGATWDEVKHFARAVAFELARVDPKRYVAIAAKAARKGRIFVDYLRNARGATAVAPYSLRARPGAPISMPIAWAKLQALTGAAGFRLEHDVAWKRPAGGDPWAKHFDSPQALPHAAQEPDGAARVPTRSRIR